MVEVALIDIENTIENYDNQPQYEMFGVYKNTVVADIIKLKLYKKENKYSGEATFVQVDTDVLYKLLGTRKEDLYWVEGPDDLSPQEYLDPLDQLPIIDIIISRCDGERRVGQIKLRNVTVLNNGWGLNIDDIERGYVYPIEVEEVVESL